MADQPSYSGEFLCRFARLVPRGLFPSALRRYVSYFDINGNPTVVRLDLGSPGKVSGTVSGSSVSIGFLRVNETKQNIGYQTTLSPDANTLTVVNPTPYGAQGFVR